jgi:hypothetical protein
MWLHGIGALCQDEPGEKCLAEFGETQLIVFATEESAFHLSCHIAFLVQIGLPQLFVTFVGVPLRHYLNEGGGEMF